MKRPHPRFMLLETVEARVLSIKSFQLTTGNLLLANSTPKIERKDWIGRARTLTSYFSAA